MKTCIQFLLILSIALLLSSQALANEGGGSFSTPEADPALAQAKMAIQNHNWDEAIQLLRAAVLQNDKNADFHNLLGYSERKRGNLDAAFKHYERALTLDPKHRGAHEYIGETYLLAGKLPQAEEHLAKLDKICFFSCEEYSDLKAAIANYKAKQTK